MHIDVSALERLPDPVVLVHPTGDTFFGNGAWRELAAGLGVPPRLASLFGPPVQVLLAEARRSGRASAFLPLAVGEDRTRGYRITVRAEHGEETLAVQLADLSEEVAWRHQLFLRNSELTVLNEIGTSLAGAHEIEPLAQRIWEQTGRIMDNANFFVALHDTARGTLRFPMWVEDGLAVEVDETHRFGRAAAEYVLLSRQPLVVNGDVGPQLELMGIPRPERPWQSFLAVPILAEGDTLGVLAVMDPTHPGRYGRREMGVLNIVATQAAAALRTAWMFDTIRAAYDELTSTQARLLESERLRGVTETVGALNHEVNNPLATIVGSAQLLLRRDDFDTATRGKIERMLEAAKRIQFVTSKMATLIQANSRPYPGQTQILDVSRSLSAMPKPAGAEVELLRQVRATLLGPPHVTPPQADEAGVRFAA